MKLQKERKETVYRYDLDCSDEEKKQLKKIAIERFAKDEHAQLEYAVVSMLTDAVNELEATRTLVKAKKSPRRTKNGSKSNNRK
jgi:hypothetical protein